MRKLALLLLFSPALAACGDGKILADVPSPDGRHHVEVRQCQQNGSWFGTEKLQVSVLAAGESENCQGFLNAVAQFDASSALDELEIEWLSDMALRAWQPGFNPAYGPHAARYQANNPIKVTFAPK